MVINKLHIANRVNTRRTIRLGFVALTDCAPLVMAQELGLFRKHGLRVTPQRELGWASIRDKVIYGDLEAAHALAAMPLAATLGLGSIRCDCLSALVLNLHGNAITLSSDLQRRGAKDGATLRQVMADSRRDEPLTFGIVFPFSSHRHLLRKWLNQQQINPDRDVRVAVVPPPQMVANLKAGHLDGFCVGEPWNSVAVLARAGWCAATSAGLDRGHPEKVLMVRRSFAEERSEEHVALLAALIDACAFCDEPANRDQLARTLARPEYVGVPLEALRFRLHPEFDSRAGLGAMAEDFCVFHRHDANEPSGEKVAWMLELVRKSGLCQEPSMINGELGRRVYRPEIYDQAIRLRSSSPTLATHGKQSENQLVVA